MGDCSTDDSSVNELAGELGTSARSTAAVARVSNRALWRSPEKEPGGLVAEEAAAGLSVTAEVEVDVVRLRGALPGPDGEFTDALKDAIALLDDG